MRGSHGMNRYATIFGSLAVCVLSATELEATPAEDMAEMIRKWVGRSEAALVETWGEPAQRVQRGRLKLYGYFGEGSRPSIRAGGFTAVPGGKSGCLVTFEIDDRGVVSNASWTTEGAADRGRARKACWREFRSNVPSG